MARNPIPPDAFTARPSKPRGGRLLAWAVGFLSLIALAAVVRRAVVLEFPRALAVSGRNAGLDAGFAGNRMLTWTHIIPSAVFVVLAPWQFVASFRNRHRRWHRWIGRLLLLLAGVIGVSALVMSFTMPTGGAQEGSATALYALLLLTFMALGWVTIRRGDVTAHREWMIRAYGITLGVATTRPIVAVFFAATRLSPQEFFGIAFWLGFTSTLVAAELWVRATRRQRVRSTCGGSGEGSGPNRVKRSTPGRN